MKRKTTSKKTEVRRWGLTALSFNTGRLITETTVYGHSLDLAQHLTDEALHQTSQGSDQLQGSSSLLHGCFVIEDHHTCTLIKKDASL